MSHGAPSWSVYVLVRQQDDQAVGLADPTVTAGTDLVGLVVAGASGVVSRDGGVSISTRSLARFEPVAFPAEIVSLVETTARDLDPALAPARPAPATTRR